MRGWAAGMGVAIAFFLGVASLGLVLTLFLQQGLGLGTVIAPLANVVLADVREQDAGSASGVLNTGFQLGNSIGLALMGVVFIDQPTVRPGAPGIFAAAVEHALWFQVGVFGLAFLLMLALPARRGHNRGTASV
jgi:predicted MFS family arabinose efflux permease